MGTGSVAGRPVGLAGAQVEARAVQPALERAALDLALGQRDLRRASSCRWTRRTRRRRRAPRRPSSPSTSTAMTVLGPSATRTRARSSAPHDAARPLTQRRSRPARPRPRRRSRSLELGDRRSCRSGRRRSRARPAGGPRPPGCRGPAGRTAARRRTGRSRCACPAPDDLAGLDLEVRHRVGAGAVGEHQVAVGLVGLGAVGLGRGSARRRSRPCARPRPAARPCRPTLLRQSRRGVVDEAAGARGAGRRRRSRGRAARRRRRGRRSRRWCTGRTRSPPRVTDDVRERGVAADRTRRAGPVHRVVGPVLDA